MPKGRLAGKTERTARWNDLDDTKFRKLVKKGRINIDDITPGTIDAVRTRHGWDNRKVTNFRTNYKRVAATIRLEREYSGARARTGESCSQSFFCLRCCIL
jgi:hypothetical protein